MTTNDRPQPLQDAAVEVRTTEGFVMGASTFLVSGGLISLNTGNLITGLYGLVPGVLALLAAILGARHVVNSATPLVTPLAAPQDNAGKRLVPDGQQVFNPAPMAIPPITTNYPPITTTSSGGSITFGPLG